MHLQRVFMVYSPNKLTSNKNMSTETFFKVYLSLNVVYARCRITWAG